MPLSIHDDVAAVWVVETRQDRAQGALTGSVLAEHGVHLAPSDVEVDVIVGNDAVEGLSDRAKLDS